MIRALIVDDERLARREMAYLLREHDEIEVVGEASGVADAARAVQELRPDVIFLDIQLGNETGFDLLESAELSCAVIFTTAYDEYAIRAFEVNALDYLLKPIEPERLREAIGRLPRGVSEPGRGAGKLTLTDLILAKSSGRLRSLRVGEIAVVTSAGDYTNVITTGGTAFFIKSTMKQWMDRLPPETFVRAHRSAIVNLTHIERLEGKPPAGCRVRVRGVDSPVPVSRRQLIRLRKRFS